MAKDWLGEGIVAAQPMSAELDVDGVTPGDLDAATGLASFPAEQRTGVIYGTDEEFLAHLADEPTDSSVE